MIPKLGRFYYINCEDKENPEGSFFGIARCVKEYRWSEDGEKLARPLYEFEHQNNAGEMCLSLYYENEIVMEAI